MACTFCDSSDLQVVSNLFLDTMQAYTATMTLRMRMDWTSTFATEHARDMSKLYPWSSLNGD